MMQAACQKKIEILVRQVIRVPDLHAIGATDRKLRNKISELVGVSSDDLQKESGKAA
jgi:hypothetical protein